MGRLLIILACLGGLLAVAGCTGKSLSTHKMIELPEGGPPVLTSAERTARAMQKPQEPGRIAQAGYQVPFQSSSQVIKPFERWTDQDAAEDALGRIGAPAVPPLIDTLHSVDPGVRRKAVEVLGRMGDEAAPAVPALTALLDDPDLTVRKAAARTLGQIGPAAKDAVPALMRNLFQNAPPEQTWGDQPPPLQSVPAPAAPQ